MKNIMRPLMICAILLSAVPVQAGETAAPDGAKVYIISPADGATLSSPVNIVFGLRGLGIAPAGIEMENTGHHHLLIDAPLPKGKALDMALQKDARHMHFGGGQTEAMVELPPGKHTLQLLLGDHNHIPHKNPVVSEVVTIEVK